MKLHPLDAVVVLLYFALILGVGFYYSRRNRNTDNYFLGERSFPGWAIGLSLIGTMISSIAFIAYPADSFKTAWVRILPTLAFPVVALFTAWLFVPFFRRAGVTSPYQYLALRFGPSVCAYVAVLFLLSMLARVAIILYLLAVLLSSMTGFSVGTAILIAGITTAVYTIKGGFTAVVWTDVIQTTLLMLGAVLCIGLVASSLPGGLSQIVSEALAAGKLSLRDLDPQTGTLLPIGTGFSLAEKTVPMLVLVGFFQFLAGKVDQTTIQRWAAARSEREARKSMLIVCVASLPIWSAFMFLGTCLWVFYQHHPTEISRGILAGTIRAEQILPHYIMTQIPHGLAGVVIAAALAAAMGAISSSINGCAMVWVRDLYQPFIARNRADGHYLRAGVGASLGVSAIMVTGAWLLHVSAIKTINDINYVLGALLGGGLLGVFMLGMFTRIGDARAIFAGVTATLAFTIYALLAQFGLQPRLFDPYYALVLGNVIMVVTVVIWSFLRRPVKRDFANLTVWDQR